MFSTIFERSGMCMARLDPQFRVLDANPDFVRQFDRAPAEMTGRGLLDLMHPSVGDRLGRQLAKLVEGRRSRVSEHVVALRAGGSAFTGELTGVAVQGHDRRTGAIVVLMRPDDQAVPGQVVVDRDRVLTEVDAKILEGVAAGMSTVQLAAQLYLSRQGVEYHVSAMLRKLKAPNRPALVSRAYALGILSVGSWPPKVLPNCVK
ncbi:PAS domain-containing protein [Solihabitans fulvus]|uniref:PAS domain-containing protein n=2 Tax=Solihabitans fulvus TaxID=1892852 RepID=A0A5B2WR28_9PSEU|nr:PAS domain-containing protein [Solihabitans fulvus]